LLFNCSHSSFYVITGDAMRRCYDCCSYGRWCSAGVRCGGPTLLWYYRYDWCHSFSVVLIRCDTVFDDLILMFWWPIYMR
jgi:hypothetical protein